MKRILFVMMLSVIALCCISCGSKKKRSKADDQISKVYYIKDITPENLVKIYEVLGREANGKVAVKVHTGEPGNPHHLDPNLIAPFVQKINGTIVECNTAYNGARDETENHMKVAQEHGFMDFAPFDLMDAEGEAILPIEGGTHLDGKDYVGKNFLNYDFLVVLSHFKGHPMGGFGGALKNISIGIASSKGKMWIHSAGHSRDKGEVWNELPAQDDFLESMAEASKAIIDHCGDRILYISVANNLSVDCDCVATPEAPEMGDIGILASLDPVALDRACVDMVYNSEDPGKVHLIERIESLHATHILDYGELLGLGSQKYELVTIK